MITGGGTGGHVYPAIAIAEALVRCHEIPRDRIWFVGSKRGIEAKVVAERGFHITLLAGRGIVRRISWTAVTAMLSLALGALQAIRLIAVHRPEVIVSVGGYAAAPCCLGAVLFRVPLVLAEANAVPGAVHRLFSRFAAASATSWPNTALRRAQVTGNPVRDEIRVLAETSRETARENARRELGIPSDRIMVSILGGSLGARSINNAANSLKQLWIGRGDVAIFHVVGARDWDDTMNVIDDGHGLWTRAVQYQDDMAQLYAASDVFVCRAGATTCAELAVVGMPAVIVPLPNTPGNHQVANAQALANADGAVILHDEHCTGSQLASCLAPIMESAQVRRDMHEHLLALGRPQAAEQVAAVVLRAKEKQQ